MNKDSMNSVLPGQERYVSTEDLDLGLIDNFDADTAPKSLWMTAWIRLRKNPIFIVSLILIIVVCLMAAFPQLFTSVDPLSCDLSKSTNGPEPGHIFGYDLQGCDVYARVIYGARASVSVGILTTIFASLFGAFIGGMAGYYGGVVDAVLARIIDIFYAIPMLLGAIVVLQLFKDVNSLWKVIWVLALFGWTQIARMTRGAVIEAKNQEFITASTALGISKFSCLIKHVLPNAIAPIIVTATVNLGGFIVSEATLSFLGLGLPSNVVSWGASISSAQSLLRTDPITVFYPSLALAITVLAFILMGDAVKDALDPKERGEK